MSSTDEDLLYRRTNLTFALLGAPKGRSREWIRRNVDGYQQISEKTLQRDLRILRSIGVPLVLTGDEIAVAADARDLPAIDFTPAEATAVGMAGELGKAGALGAFARSGWTKIAAAGARRDLSGPQLASYTPYNDTTRLEPTVLSTILTAVARQRRISFTYRASPTDEPQQRVMDPWGLVPEAGRVYLVGYDLDRESARSFRAVRLSDVQATEQRAEHPAEGNLQDIVRGSLSARSQLVDAVLSVTAGKGGEFGEPVDGRIHLSNVDADWLVRAAAAAAPEVIVEKPAEIRRQVIELLEKAAS